MCGKSSAMESPVTSEASACQSTRKFRVFCIHRGIMGNKLFLRILVMISTPHDKHVVSMSQSEDYCNIPTEDVTKRNDITRDVEFDVCEFFYG